MCFLAGFAAGVAAGAATVAASVLTASGALAASAANADEPNENAKAPANNVHKNLFI